MRASGEYQERTREDQARPSLNALGAAARSYQDERTNETSGKQARLRLVTCNLSPLSARSAVTSMNTETADQQPHLQRRFGLLQATALNMSNMIGIGPFITIPLLMSAMGGPQAMLGWLVAVLIAIPDGMIWSELGAAMPGSGGSYVYLREAFGRETFGRLMAFLFIWQFILSGPLEIASGYIGFIQYSGYFWRDMAAWHRNLLSTAMGLLVIALLYRQINSIARITIWLWVGTLLTTGAVIVTGAFTSIRNWPSTSLQTPSTFPSAFSSVWERPR